MNHKDEIRDELKEISPFLADLKKENAFKVPVHYFEQLPDQVMEQIKWSSPPVVEKAPQVSWMNQLATFFSKSLWPGLTLAGLGLVIVTGVFLFRKGAAPAIVTNDFPLEEAEAYVSANIDEFEEEQLLALALIDNDQSLDVIKIEGFSDDELINEILNELESDDFEGLF